MNYQPNKQAKNFQEGFTLIEILVVIFIMALLLTFTAISLNTARAKARDIRRVSDVRQLQNALELYFYDKNIFPAAANAVLGSADFKVFCDTTAGFQANNDGCVQIYFPDIPVAPTPPTGNSYVYSSTDGKTYTIAFTLEKETSALSAGAHTATPEGIR